MSLAKLEAEIARDLARLNYGGEDWTVPKRVDGEPVLDVAIIGGGQSGLGTAFGLLRQRISNILILDENPEGYEGPWDTYARMKTLRTPKNLIGIDFGVPSLTFRAWWEAQHGEEGWEALGKIPRGEWMDYLRWYRKTLDLPVRNDAKLELIEPLESGIYKLHLAGGAVLFARKVVLATGIQGGGQWWVPDFVKQAVRPERYAHTSDAVTPDQVKGKRVAILGGGASAFDNAHHALEAGASSVDVFMRRKQLPRINPIRIMERIALPPRYPSLSDADKYAVMASFFRHNQPPTNDMFEAACAYPNFELHLGAPWESLSDGEDGVAVTTPVGHFTFDFLILSTGLVSDPALRPELDMVADSIMRWGDCYDPPEALSNPVLDAHPYLGPAFEFRARKGASEAAVSGIYAFNYAALLSIGLSASAISGLDHALPRLTTGIANALFLDDKDELLDVYYTFSEEEFLGEWPREEARAAE